MKKIVLLVGVVALLGSTVVANGVLFTRKEQGSYLPLIETIVKVNINGQVASTVALGVFHNPFADSLDVKFAFPLPEGASATGLRYKINGGWYQASFSPVPQDSTIVNEPGQDDQNLRQFLGSNPLFYEFEHLLHLDSTLIVELTYVEFLKYRFGNVNYQFPNDYTRIQNEQISHQQFELVLNSERTIEALYFLSHDGAVISNNGNVANLFYEASSVVANTDLVAQFRLSLNELGLFALSTFIPDSFQLDEYGRGFFSFIAEPDPSDNSEVISKVFTLIIDRSGSMSGNKMVQAKDAARFIVENLNEGDKFNIVSFASNITRLWDKHKEYDIENRTAAIDYIQALDAGGMTHISGAFDMAVPQFQSAGENSANIIIFITDGEQTAGIIDTDALIEHINSLIITSERQISLFNFGVGPTVNERLLTTIANRNSGLAEYLKDEELENVITDFYLMIQSPVLLNTKLTFTPADMVEVYPARFPNLYKGNQMMVVGRYSQPAEILTTLSGNAYSSAVDYQYTINLSDTFQAEMLFLTKLWARGKIDFLMEQYYLNMDNIAIKDSIREEVISISLNYGVMSIFTSFQGSNPDDGDDYGGGITTGVEYDVYYPGSGTPSEPGNEFISVKALYPNPATSHFTLVLEPKSSLSGLLTLELLDARGNMIQTQRQPVWGSTPYRFSFDVHELNLKSGVYFLVIHFHNKTITCRIVVR